MKPIFIFLIALLTLNACREARNAINISGKAQGTTYNITYLAGPYSNYRESIDSIFTAIDMSLSTYVPGSIISRVNRNEPGVTVDEHFIEVFKKSMEVSDITQGAFDITVAPLVNAYGFGANRKRSVDQILLDSILPLVGYKKISLQGDKIIKENPGMKVDMNAIAQGYTVDVLASFLESKGIQNYLVELGGELRAKGEKLDGSVWNVGIEKPDEDQANERSLYTQINLENRSLATSGNYRQFYEEDGKKYTHIINPITGYPAKNNLLSATVIAPDCVTADAYATSFIVMGLERSKQFLASHKELGLDVYFIYDEQGKWMTYITENLDRQLLKSQ